MVTSSAQDDTRTVDRSILFNAINSASPSRLQAVLREICSVEPKAYKLACDLLLVAIDDDNNSSNNNSDAAVASPPPKHKLDTLQQRFEVCVQCKEEFDVSKNLEGDCMWHSGELEQDWQNDFWFDHDEGKYGPVDTPENRRKFPDGFVWSCCDGDTEDYGCERGVHVMNSGKRVRVGM